MAKGASEKQSVMAAILTAFPGSFTYDKEIRIPINDVQIKVTLTCAKENVSADGAPQVAAVSAASTTIPEDGFPVVKKEPVKVTEDEKANIAAMMSKLGL